MHLPVVLCRLGLLAGLIGLSPAVFADAGHSHDAPPAAVAGPALPRFAVASDAFELVGVLDGRQLQLWLDHAADNRPVEGARLALEIGDRPVAVTATGPGTFAGTLDAPLADGTTPVTATVRAGSADDLLAAEFDIAEPHDDHDHGVPGSRLRRAAVWAAAAAAVALLMLVVVRTVRRRATGRAAA